MTELRARWMALSLRERRMIAVAGPLGLLLLLFIAWSVNRRTAAPPPVVAVSAPTPPAQPMPVPVVSVAPPVTVTAPAPGGVTLFGVSGGGPAGRAATLGAPNGGQRVVAVGRDYRGMIVKEVGLDFAVLSGPGGEVRLELNRGGSPAAPGSPPPPAR